MSSTLTKLLVERLMEQLCMLVFIHLKSRSSCIAWT